MKLFQFLFSIFVYFLGLTEQSSNLISSLIFKFYSMTSFNFQNLEQSSTEEP